MKALLVSLFILVVSACADALPYAASAPGAIVPAASSQDSALFKAGRALFHRQFEPEDGLGPLFNQSRCSSCHDLPVIGGTGTEFVQKVTRFEQGRCNLLLEKGGDMMQAHATPALQAQGVQADPFPREANAFARILPPALFGAGLIEAIPADQIRAHADPDDRDGDGVSGRLGESFDQRLGRFGRKATFADLRSFIESAALGEMGLTSASDSREEKPGGRELPAGVDPTPEPELSAAQLEQLTRFVQLLAAPARERADPRDQRVFERAGCAACHIAEFSTESDLPALDQKRVALFSDLLLHDLGAELATVCAPSAAPSEWRTAPLMGLRYRNQFMHDGRSQTLENAIEAHGGEAAASRDAFRRLSEPQREQLLRFLRSL